MIEQITPPQPQLYVVRRRHDDEEKWCYYHHFDGRHGIPGPKRDAPRFDETTVNTLLRHLEKLDNREWEKVPA